MYCWSGYVHTSKPISPLQRVIWPSLIYFSLYASSKIIATILILTSPGVSLVRVCSHSISLLQKGHPAITYLFQPLCLPQRLFVMILILTSPSVSLVRVCLHFRRSIRWSRKCVPTWSGSSTLIPQCCAIFKLLFIYIYYIKSMRNVELSKLTVWDNELALDENFLCMGVKTYLF